ncbi:Hypothetical protein, putative [Bodo saltans]|uniref:Uncharacterized protein n=1 Tax=Bodo saltans TaxID=75058 RepID=A0A0S4JQA9_BODSA|nr:Hypothetical protein, putative [Bodo saltans]|eukprot:CUG93710.1 Hypothetical protein, putative [Bodo saltans]
MARNSLSIAALHDAVERVLGGFFAPPAEFRSGPPVTIALVLDEFGGHPSVVRGLCAAMFDDIHTKLNPLFNFAVELKVIVVGTGTDLKHGLGSIYEARNTFETDDKDKAEAKWNELVVEALHDAVERVLGGFFAPPAEFRSGPPVTIALVLDEFGGHPSVVRGLCAAMFDDIHTKLNPLFNFAVELKVIVVGTGTDLKHSVEAARSCVDAYLFAAARDFKLLNAMNMVTRENVALYYKHAIGLLLRNPQDGRRLTNVEFILQLEVGVLTDCAFWADVLPAGHVEVGGARTEETNRHGEMVSLILVAPETGRYAMSMAQHLLFRMCYGFDEFLPAASWQRAEVVFAEYVSVLLSGLNGQRLRELLVRLGMPEACCENAALLEQTMSFGAVSTVHSGKWICPADRCRNADDVTTTDTGATREEFARLLLQQCEPPIRGSGPTEAEARKRAEGTAVVIVNAPGAPYAGVIVVIRRVAVILIQCKMLGDETEVVDIEADAEKLSGELTELNKMAGVPPGAYFRVLVTNIATEKVPSDLHGLFVFTTSTTNNATSDEFAGVG